MIISICHIQQLQNLTDQSSGSTFVIFQCVFRHSTWVWVETWVVWINPNCVRRHWTHLLRHVCLLLLARFLNPRWLVVHCFALFFVLHLCLDFVLNDLIDKEYVWINECVLCMPTPVYVRMCQSTLHLSGCLPLVWYSVSCQLNEAGGSEPAGTDGHFHWTQCVTVMAVYYKHWHIWKRPQCDSTPSQDQQ